MCPECKKMDGNIEPWPNDATGGKIPNERYNEKNGWASSLSERIWKFNNQVAQKVSQANPDIMMACFAYAMYANPPKEIKKIEDNLIVCVCDYYLANGAPDEYQKGKDVFLEWAKKAKNLGIRGYYYSIGCRPHRIAETLRLLYNIGCRFHTAESSQTYGFNWIEYIINCKAQWDPYLDVDVVINDYFQAAYGPGAPAMKKHLALQEKVSMGYNTFSTFQNPKLMTANWTKPVREELRGYLDEALRATGKTGEYADRVRFAEEAWEMLDAYCELHAALIVLRQQGVAVPYIDDTETQNSTPAEVRKGIEEANRHWQRLKNVMTRVEEKQDYSIPWYSKFIYPNSREGRVIDAWERVVDNLYEQVCLNGGIALPALWAFRIDPKEEGQKGGWFKPEFRDDDWDRIRTDDWWEKQGYGVEKFPENKGEGYNGKAWYRLRATVPAERKGGKAWLLLGAVDESFTAWVNGEKVGEFRFAEQDDKSAWQKEHRIEITNVIQPGGENTIAVEVEDKGGMGGIWKPCFIVFDDVKKK